MIYQDSSIEIDCHPVYMWWLITKMRGSSIRDLKFFIDTAKIISIANDNVTENNKIVLTKRSFDLSLEQLRNESSEHRLGFIYRHRDAINQWHIATGLLLNSFALYLYGQRIFDYCSSMLWSKISHATI